MNPWNGLRGLPARAWIVCSSTLVNRMGTMARPFLVLYLVERRGFSESQAGLALSFYGGAALIAAPLAGRACDRFGALRIMRWSLLLSGLLLTMFPLVTTPGAILAFIFAWASVGEAYRPANLAMLTGLAPPGRIRAVLALNRVAINLGMSVGPAVGGLLAAWSYAAVFIVDGVMSVISSAVLWLAVKSTTETRPVSRSTSAGALRDHRLLYVLAALLPVMMVFFQLAATLPLFLVRNLHKAPTAYGFLMVVNTVLIILFEVPLNLRMERWPHRLALTLGALFIAAGFGGYAFTGTVAAVVATTIVWTVGEMILLPGSAAYLAEIAPEGRTGEYMGLYSMTFNIAFAIGPWLGAEVLERQGARPLWLAALALGLAGAALLSRLRHNDSTDAGIGAP
ncbi:MAG: MFS transporter [Bryobacteraceae bacterium]